MTPKLPKLQAGDRVYFATMGTVVSADPLLVEYDDADGRVSAADVLAVDRGDRTIYRKAHS